MGDTFTTPTFFNRFDLGWYITNETHVLGGNGELFWELEAITVNKCHLLKHLHLRKTTGWHQWLLIATSPAFFTD